MRERIMRTLVFFDLPMTTARERKIYTKFRKALIKDGFVMVQESIYSKLFLNLASAQAGKERVRYYAPNKGSVKVLIITERQYASIEDFSEGRKMPVLDTTARLVIF